MVYVDRLRDWGWRLGPSCHLVADTNEELHEFAARLGMKRKWFQRYSSYPHYDLTAGMRAKAVKIGAVELGDRPFAEMVKKGLKEVAAKIKAAETEEEKRAVREHFYR